MNVVEGSIQAHDRTKVKMQFKNYLNIGVAVLLVACNQTSNKKVETKDSTATKTEVVAVTAPSFEDDKLQKIYTAYISLKDALVSTKAPEAQIAAQVLAQELKTYSGCENTAVTAHKIEQAKDIITQRKEFTALSSDVIAMFKHADLKSGSIFVQHCPMANKGEGGDWLSSDKKIQNPYYGSEMMECGAVVDEIKTTK